MKIEQLNGKPVTVVYSIEDAAEWEKTNPLTYEHHGLKAYGCSASDLMERCDRLERGLRIIAQMEKDPDRFATDEQIAKHYLEDSRGARAPSVFPAARGSETLFELEPSMSGRVRAAGEREVRRAKAKEWKAAYGIFAYKGGCEDWMALSMPECIARLDGYGLTAEEKTCGAALVGGYGRLLDDASLIEYGPTEFETCKALVGRLGGSPNAKLRSRVERAGNRTRASNLLRRICGGSSRGGERVE